MMRPWYKIGLLVLLIFVLSGICAAVYMFYLEEADSAVLKPDYVITAEDLQKEFLDNEGSASEKYVNKIVEVKGRISSIEPGEGSSINISLDTGTEISEVICTLSSGNIPLKLKTGDVVTIRGRCSGYLMDVLLNNCAVIAF
ncbi:MAG TPA: hypothetical protein VHO68_03955 [Bacteroidales bacterium]|nr:hypothetical protein [Bacteroidales bacterium]